MKKSSFILLVAALFSVAITYYFMNFADGGADGLSSFIFIILFGVLSASLFIAFLLSFFLREGQSKRTRNLIIGLIVMLPIIGILAVVGVFGYFTYDYQNQWEVQIESDKSVLNTIQFQDEDFGVKFNHVSGNISAYEGDVPVPTSITPKIENGMLFVPFDDESYLEPDILIKLENKKEITLSNYLEELNSKLGIDVKFENGAIDDFPNLSMDTEILMLGEDVSYELREKIGKNYFPQKTGQSDLIYFFKLSKQPERIWVLVVSGKAYSVPATVNKMSTDNFGTKNLWFHTLEFIY